MKAGSRRLGAAVAALCCAWLLAGCSSTTRLDGPAQIETRTPVPLGGDAGAGGAGATPGAVAAAAASTVVTADAARGGGGTALPAAQAPHVIYFDFDSFAIKAEYQPIIDSYAKALTANRGRQLVVEGHTDQRGGSEYNLALGQKRAEAVVGALKLLGAADSQLEAVSFGKERPANPENNEAAWAQNRRVELKDR